MSKSKQHAPEFKAKVALEAQPSRKTNPASPVAVISAAMAIGLRDPIQWALLQKSDDGGLT